MGSGASVNNQEELINTAVSTIVDTNINLTHIQYSVRELDQALPVNALVCLHIPAHIAATCAELRGFFSDQQEAIYNMIMQDHENDGELYYLVNIDISFNATRTAMNVVINYTDLCRCTVFTIVHPMAIG